MSYTLGDLKAELRPAIWPTGEAENLVIPHDRIFVEALVDLQQWVDCLQINNTQIVPFCDTLFKCGLTVTDAPRGRINRIYTVDKINQTTGREDASVDTDWCSMVDYRQVDYTDLDRYLSQTLAGTLPTGFWGWCGMPDIPTIAFPSTWCEKYAYPPPDDAGLSKAPPLPIGFHYAQTSTDDPDGTATQANQTGVRAQYGLWALKGGQIFLAPWIQSTELIVIEWDGIKRAWQDLDQVDDDPILKQAVEWYIRWQIALRYDRDYEAATAAVQNYNEARARLIYECRKETEVRGGGAGSDGGGATSAARGASLVVPTFTNDAQNATAKCPSDQTGDPVGYTVPAGTVVSTVSVADANAKAKSLALQKAGQQLNCQPIPVTYLNAPQSATAQCGTGIGEPVTVTIPAGQFSSIVSQADADAQALAAATAQAQQQIKCTYVNTEQSFQATCPAGHFGTPVTITIPAGTYTSMVSQADADAQAKTAAETQANAAIVCSGSPPVYYNDAQSLTRSLACVTKRGVIGLSVRVDVVANMFSSLISQFDANNKAITYGNQLALTQLTNECSAMQGR